MSGALKRLPDPREKPWLTVAELAQITGEGEKAIRAALDAGQLPLLRVGRYCRIPTAALLHQLGLSPGNTEAGPATGPTTATASTPPRGVSDEQHAPAPASVSNVRPIRGS